MPTSPLYYPPFLSTHTLITVAAQCSQNKRGVIYYKRKGARIKVPTKDVNCLVRIDESILMSLSLSLSLASLSSSSDSRRTCRWDM